MNKSTTRPRPQSLKMSDDPLSVIAMANLDQPQPAAEVPPLTDKRNDGMTETRTDGMTEGREDRQPPVFPSGQTDSRPHGQTEGRQPARQDGQPRGRAHEQAEGRDAVSPSMRTAILPPRTEPQEIELTDENMVEFVRQVLASKRTLTGGNKTTVDMSPALARRAAQYSLDHCKVPARSMFVELLDAFLTVEGY